MAKDQTWRNKKKWRMFKKTILKRDNYTCVICGSKKNPQVHHIYDASTYPKYRYKEEYCVTLCKDCHIQYHTNFLRNFRVKSTLYKWKNFLDLVNYFGKKLCNRNRNKEDNKNEPKRNS